MTGFGEVVGQRFLGVDVFAHFHCSQGCGVMSVVGGGDGNRVDFVAQAGEHFPVVLKGLGALVLLGSTFEAFGIDVTQA